MGRRPKGDFPIANSEKRDAHKMLEEIAGLSFSEGHVSRLAAQGRLCNHSWDIERFIAGYRPPGGYYSWKDDSPTEGHMTIDETAKTLDCHRSTVYVKIKNGTLETVRIGRRQFVSESSVRTLVPGIYLWLD